MDLSQSTSRVFGVRMFQRVHEAKISVDHVNKATKCKLKAPRTLASRSRLAPSDNSDQYVFNANESLVNPPRSKQRPITPTDYEA